MICLAASDICYTIHVLCVLCLSSIVGYIDVLVFFFQAEDGIRDLVRSRGLGDVYKRQRLRLYFHRRYTFD